VELGTQVGYRIGQGDHVDSRESVITFVTVGYMLQYLSHNPSAMHQYSHVVLDEVHERSMDMDLLNLLIKKLMQLNRDSGQRRAKLIVMSATLQSGLFGEYFTPTDQSVADPIFVGARRFPVQALYLENLLNALPALRNTCGSFVSRAVNAFESAVRVHTQGKAVASGVASGGSLVKAEVSPELRKIICEAVRRLCQPDSCILIFLPGIGEIGALQDDLEAGAQWPAPLQVLVLHSLVPKEEQDVAMAAAKAGHCKIILSTNIAESSITIPDVRVVLDTGLHRGIFYDDKRRMPALLCTWCSQSSGKQRAGRAGRVAPGTIFYLFTKSFHESVMPGFDEAEITRVPLEKTVLRVKLLLNRFGSTTQLLAQALTPPPPERVILALKVLYDAGAITSDDEEAEVSELCRLAADMPVDLTYADVC
jgi:HrpA-like RNA helicase